MMESGFTKSTHPIHKYEDQITDYNWSEEENNSNTLVLAKQVISEYFKLFINILNSNQSI